MSDKFSTDLSELYLDLAEALTAKCNGVTVIDGTHIDTIIQQLNSIIKTVKRARRSARNERLGRVVGKTVNVAVKATKKVTDKQSYSRLYSRVQALNYRFKAETTGRFDEIMDGYETVRAVSNDTDKNLN